MLQKHLNKGKFRLCAGAVILLDQPTHLNSTKASCIHSSSLILCWFSHLFLIFLFLYAPNNLIKLVVAFSKQPPPDSSSHCSKSTWTTEAPRWIEVSIETFSHSPSPREAAGAGVFRKYCWTWAVWGLLWGMLRLLTHSWNELPRWKIEDCVWGHRQPLLQPVS